jgi:multidrug efflux pump subunit AcrA (membrane-fusion protein)
MARVESLALFLSLLVLCRPGVASAETPKASVIAMKVEPQEVADKMLYPARIAALRSVSVPAEVEGFVQTLDAVLGQNVRAGQTLVRLSNPDPVYEFKSFTIKAPFSGIVSSIDIVVGDRVTRGKNLLTLADSSSLKILVHLTADDVKKLQARFPGKLHIGKQEYPIRVKAMSPIIDPSTGTAPCEWELVDGNGKQPLVAGSIAQVSFTSNQRKAVILPERAVVYRGKDPFVVRLSKDLKAQYVPITIVKQSGGQVEIKSDVQAGETIVASSQGFVVDGETVTVASTKGG